MNDNKQREKVVLDLDCRALAKDNLEHAITAMRAHLYDVLEVPTTEKAFVEHMTKVIETNPVFVLGFLLGISAILENTSVPAFLTDHDRNAELISVTCHFMSVFNFDIEKKVVPV